MAIKLYSKLTLATITQSTYNQAKSIYHILYKFVHIESRPKYLQHPDCHILLLFISYLAYDRQITYAFC